MSFPSFWSDLPVLKAVALEEAAAMVIDEISTGAEQVSPLFPHTSRVGASKTAFRCTFVDRRKEADRLSC